MTTKQPAWSPVMCLPVAALTKSGLLQLDSNDGEVELTQRKGIELRYNGGDTMDPIDKNNAKHQVWVDRNSDLTLIITTHRLVWFVESNHARFLHLANVHQADATGGGMFSSFKIALTTYLGDLLIVCPSKSDRDSMLNNINTSMQRREWETATRLKEKQQTKASHVLTSRKVGLDAIMTKNKLKHQEAKQLAEDAFSGDTSQLLQEAAELIGVIHKYVSTIKKNAASSSSSNNDNDDNDKYEELTAMLADMGMTTSAVSVNKDDFKGRDSTEYYETLARQVSDLVEPKLKRLAGGSMTLTDVYCLFNRARGSNLISPDDLVQAMNCTLQLNLPIKIRIFPSSNIKVVQLVDMDTKKLSDQFLELCQPCVTSLQVSKALHLSPLLAHEHLVAAEEAGILCRDVTLETTRFFPNLFLTKF